MAIDLRFRLRLNVGMDENRGKERERERERENAMGNESDGRAIGEEREEKTLIQREGGECML